MLTPEEIISKLRPCHYHYNKVKELGDKVNFGFIAQDLLEDFGEKYNFVQKDEKEEFYQVNYHQFIAPLVSVVKKQQEELKLLKEEIKELKDRL